MNPITPDVLLFVVLPYAALAVAVLESVRRYWQRRFSYSSLSSQFLEGEHLFAGSVPWHYGILWVLTGHFVAFLFPRELLAFNAVPVRLYILEVTALSGGLLALVGLANLIARRLRDARVRAVTSVMDVVILALLLLQVGLGVYTALVLRWGSNWFAAALAPYLQSLCLFRPDLTLVSPLPLVIKLHMANAFVLLALLPFSRLVHFLVVPWQYLWRPRQVVIWNRDRKQSGGVSASR